MASKKFKKIFLIRFVTYFMLLTGLSFVVVELGPLIVAEVNYRKNQFLGISYSLPPVVVTSSVQAQLQASPTPQAGSAQGFADLPNTTEHLIRPVSTEYGIVIEKINANARVISGVDPSNQKEYVEALGLGVAEAKGSTKPGEAGNLFLFSHSTDAPWNIIRYNAIFYLLRELEVGDRVSIFYKNVRFDYIVYDKSIITGDDISFLTNRYDKPVLTLQTCDPPGTVLNRLIVRAKLLGS